MCVTLLVRSFGWMASRACCLSSFARSLPGRLLLWFAHGGIYHPWIVGAGLLMAMLVAGLLIVGFMARLVALLICCSAL